MFRFLKAVMSLARKGVKQEDILKFAKQEFGEVTDELKKIINRIYSRTKSQGSRTKDQKKGEVVPFRDKNNLTEDDPMGDLEKIVRNEGDVGLPKDEGIMSTDEADLQKKIIDQVNEAYGKKGMQEDMPETFNLPDQVREQLGYPNRMIEGAVRTAARELLLEKGINVAKGKDPINTFREVFGEDALEIVDGIQDQLLEVSNFPELKRVLQENKLYDLEPKKGVNIKETKEVEEITEFDPEGRKPNSEGGINRLGFFAGSTKLPKLIKAGKGKFTAAQVLIERLKNTIKSMPEDEYVQSTFPNFIKEIEQNPKLAENKQVQEALGFRDLPKNQRLVEYDDGTFDFYTQGKKGGMESAEKLAEELGISMEDAVKIKMMEPEDQILEIEMRKRIMDQNRKKNAKGGLNYLMGLE